MAREIALTQGKVAVIDDEDFAAISEFKWCAQKAGDRFYAVSNTRGGAKNRRRIQMHQLIGNAPQGFEVDHENNNGLDNRRSNLRIATRRQNCGNRGKARNNTSGFKGVSWHKNNRSWVSVIGVNGKLRFLGYFHDLEEAAHAYDKAALEVFGPFARLNFPAEETNP